MAVASSHVQTVPARVLIVDDDPAIRFGLAALLRSRGYEVLEAGTFDGALEAVVALPDIIVVDLRLPDGDGLELLPRLRKRAPDAIVVVTGYKGFWVREKNDGVPVEIDGCGLKHRTVTMTFGQRLEVKNLTNEFWTPMLEPKSPRIAFPSQVAY